MGSRNLRAGSWTIDLHSGVMFHVNKNFKWLQLLRLQIWLYRISAEKPFMLSRFDSMRNKWFDALLSYGWRRCGNIRLCSAGQLPVCMQTEEFRYGYNSGFHIPIVPAMRVLWYLSDASVWYIASLPAIALPTVKSSLSFAAHCELAFACPQFCFTWNKGWVLTWIRGMIGNFDRNFSHESIVLSRSYISSKDRQDCISLVSDSNWKTKIKWFFCQKAGGLKTGIAPPEAVGTKREDRVVASIIQRNYRYGDGYYFLES